VPIEEEEGEEEEEEEGGEEEEEEESGPKKELNRKAAVRHKVYFILFQHARNFQLLVSFPIILTLPHFQRIY
jgi:hypothetical protein